MNDGNQTPTDEAADVRLWQRWRQGQRVDVGEFLVDFPELTAIQLVAVLLIDQCERWQLGERVPSESYLRRFPQLEADAEAVVELAFGEYVLRDERHDRPMLEEYLWRFPQHERRLRQQVVLHLALRNENPTAPEVAEHDASSEQITLVQKSSETSGLPNVPGYEILSVLGRGGMGVVYRARQVKANRLVALKVLLAGSHASAAETERFRTEAEAIARLQHPNIVQVFDVGDHAGLPFFSLEFCPGGSLDRKLNGTPMPPNQAAALVETLALAMHAAHQKGIIHRDLKPANVLLQKRLNHPDTETHRSEENEIEDNSFPSSLLSASVSMWFNSCSPKISDFGLAKKLDEQGQTQTGALIGTPSYMSPEQAQGKHVAPAADVYALGAILYECLTGRPPFKAATTAETIRQVINDQPVSPSQLQSRTPRDLETICLACLRKEPDIRYANAQALADDLRRWQAGEPIAARPVGRLERGLRWCVRNPAVAGLLATVALTLSLGAGVATVLAVIARQAQQQSEQDAADARAARDEARDDRDRATAAERERAAHLRRAEWLAYAGKINLALQEWKHGDGAVAWQNLESSQFNKRGWEYAYLRTLFLSNQRTLREHNGPVRSVAYSSDGRRLASGGTDRTIKVWDLLEEKVIHSLRAHTGPITCVAFSPDGKRLASTSEDRSIRVWDVNSGRTLLVLTDHQASVSSVAFSPDGSRLVSGSRDRTIKVWDLERGKAVLNLTRHQRAVNSVAFSPTGNRLASGSDDKTVKVWDAQTGDELFSLRSALDRETVYCVAFSCDGKQLAGANQTTIKIWDMESGNESGLLHPGVGVCRSIAFSKDGKQLACANEWNFIQLWDLANKRVAGILKGHRSGVNCVVYHPDGRRLASASDDRTVKIWDPARGEDSQSFTGHGWWVLGVAFHPDSRQLASASQDKTVKVWDVKTRRVVASLDGHGAPVRTVAWSPDGRQLFSAGHDGKVKVWDMTAKKESFSLTHTSPLSCVAHGLVGRQLASGGADGTIQLWDLDRKRVIRSFKGHGGWISSVAFHPDGKRLVSASLDGTARIWDLARGEEVHCLTGHEGKVNCVCCSSDGKHVATAGEDRTVRVWEAQTGRPLLTLRGHVKRVVSVCFAPGGKRLASGGDDDTVRLWELDEGQEILCLRGHLWSVNCLSFSPDGRRLASGSTDWTIKVWDATPPDELKLRRELARSAATHGAWQQAASDFARLLELRPDDDQLWYSAVLVHAQLGNEKEYRRLCRGMVERFAATTDSGVAQRTARAGLLIGGAVEDLPKLSRLVDLVVADDPDSRSKPWICITKALAEYRSGHYSEAADWLQTTLSRKRANHAQNSALFLLALTQQQRGRVEEAKVTMARARPRTDRLEQTDAFWANALFADLLRREAEALVAGVKADR